MAQGSVQDDLRDRPVGELLKELSTQTTTLVSQELELAKAEMAEKGKRAGLGAGMFGGAGLFGLLALGALTACLIAALATGMDVWLAALIVAVAYAAVAAVLAILIFGGLALVGTPNGSNRTDPPSNGTTIDPGDDSTGRNDEAEENEAGEEKAEDAQSGEIEDAQSDEPEAENESENQGSRGDAEDGENENEGSRGDD